MGKRITKMKTLITERGLATSEDEECFGGFLVTFKKGEVTPASHPESRGSAYAM